MLRKIIEALYWRYQEQDNWKMKMNEPIKIKKLTEEEVQEILGQRRKNQFSPNHKYTIGISDGKYDIPDDIDSTNNEIAGLFEGKTKDLIPLFILLFVIILAIMVIRSFSRKLLFERNIYVALSYK